MKNFKRILPDMDSLCYEAARDLLRLSHQAIDERGAFHIFLAGGSTPQSFYKLLASSSYANAIRWGKVHLYFGDERNVPPDHRDSNYNMVNNALLKKINIDPTHIHRIHGELAATQAAVAYNNVLNYRVPKDADDKIQPDLVLLGVGSDGHIASLFPGTDILNKDDSHCAAVWVEKLKSWRISITYPVINNARNLWFFVAGDAKEDIVDRIFNHPSVIDPLPVERIAAKGNITWFMDQAAAKWIKK
jgi:6-phosphogluconolactonase